MEETGVATIARLGLVVIGCVFWAAMGKAENVAISIAKIPKIKKFFLNFLF
jgi:hypothetical protein